MNSKMQVVDNTRQNQDVAVGAKSLEQSRIKNDSPQFDTLLAGMDTKNHDSSNIKGVDRNGDVAQKSSNARDKQKKETTSEKDPALPMDQDHEKTIVDIDILSSNEQQVNSEAQLGINDQDKSLKSTLKDVVGSFKNTSKDKIAELNITETKSVDRIKQKADPGSMHKTETLKLNLKPEILISGEKTDSIIHKGSATTKASRDVAKDPTLKAKLKHGVAPNIEDNQSQEGNRGKLKDTQRLSKMKMTTSNNERLIKSSDTPRLAKNQSLKSDSIDKITANPEVDRVAHSITSSRTKSTHRQLHGETIRIQDKMEQSGLDKDFIVRQHTDETGRETKNLKRSAESFSTPNEQSGLDRNNKSSLVNEAPTKRTITSNKELNQTIKIEAEKQVTPSKNQEVKPQTQSLAPEGKYLDYEATNGQLEISKKKSPIRSKKVKQKTSFLKGVKRIYIGESVHKNSQIRKHDYKNDPGGPTNNPTMDVKQNHSQDFQSSQKELDFKSGETSGATEILQEKKHVPIQNLSQTAVMTESPEFGQKHSINKLPNVRAISTVLYQKIQDLTDLSADTKRTQARFIVDGGKYGNLEIEFSIDDIKNHITITVDSELNKNELQRITPQIHDNLAQKGMDLSGLNVEVRDSKKEEQRDRESNNSRPLANELPVQNSEKQSNARNYGYNTMEVLA